MSQEQLALLCDTDRSYLGKIERREVNSTLTKIYLLGWAMNIDVKGLLAS